MDQVDQIITVEIDFIFTLKGEFDGPFYEFLMTEVKNRTNIK